MGNGMNKILTGLYIGNFKDARDAEQLSKNKVTHILSVHDSARPMLEMPDLHVLEMEEPQSSPVLPPHSAHGKWRQGVKYLCIPAADSPSQNLTRHFKESIKFIHECRLQGEGCLVHCLAGVSRSVTLVIAYIMTVTDFGWEDALHTVRAGRSCANPNLGFQRQLQEFEKHEVQQVSRRVVSRCTSRIREAGGGKQGCLAHQRPHESCHRSPVYQPQPRPPPWYPGLRIRFCLCLWAQFRCHGVAGFPVLKPRLCRCKDFSCPTPANHRAVTARACAGIPSPALVSPGGIHVCDSRALFPTPPVSPVAEGRVWREPLAGC
uniref:Dual specificity phosphatase 22 n=1 Tax=Oryctolagus cuniculus TaxID=9986 RepID=A0A5F9C5N0_RABIT